MSKQNKRDKDESLLEVFLSTSDGIDSDIEKAKEILKEEGLDPELLRMEGIAFIKSLQKRNETEKKTSIDFELSEQQNRAHAVVSGFIKNGESSPSAKLKESDVVEILDLFLKNPGANKTHCARKYGIKDTTVHKILNGHRWVRTYKKWLTTKTPEE